MVSFGTNRIGIEPVFTSPARTLPSADTMTRCFYAPEGLVAGGGGGEISWDSLRSKVIYDDNARAFPSLETGHRLENRMIVVRNYQKTLNKLRDRVSVSIGRLLPDRFLSLDDLPNIDKSLDRIFSEHLEGFRQLFNNTVNKKDTTDDNPYIKEVFACDQQMIKDMADAYKHIIRENYMSDAPSRVVPFECIEGIIKTINLYYAAKYRVYEMVTFDFEANTRACHMDCGFPILYRTMRDLLQKAWSESGKLGIRVDLKLSRKRKNELVLSIVAKHQNEKGNLIPEEVKTELSKLGFSVEVKVDQYLVRIPVSPA